MLVTFVRESGSYRCGITNASREDALRVRGALDSAGQTPHELTAAVRYIFPEARVSFDAADYAASRKP